MLFLGRERWPRRAVAVCCESPLILGSGSCKGWRLRRVRGLVSLTAVGLTYQVTPRVTEHNGRWVEGVLNTLAPLGRRCEGERSVYTTRMITGACGLELRLMGKSAVNHSKNSSQSSWST
ncbi:hypothetical protein SKAU_G00257540 [Synaphobranchus kaupii]|uniref:Uncharacterized protein n=1 Tax=Synaphobranchus kaupii TaxID=118154 RepID=A0A9Q1F438_SYNKA|nr:hypothetical protein SKAU_G00257540 [Synaphobranchus kaupii]